MLKNDRMVAASYVQDGFYKDGFVYVHTLFDTGTDVCLNEFYKISATDGGDIVIQEELDTRYQIRSCHDLSFLYEGNMYHVDYRLKDDGSMRGEKAPPTIVKQIDLGNMLPIVVHEDYKNILDKEQVLDILNGAEIFVSTNVIVDKDLKINESTIIDWSRIHNIPENVYAEIYLLDKDGNELGLIKQSAHTLSANRRGVDWYINTYWTGSELIGDSIEHQIISGEYRVKVVIDKKEYVSNLFRITQ